VSAFGKELHLEVRIATGNASNLLEDLAREKRIVDRAEEERPDANSREKSNRARTRVIVVRVGKAMDRSRDNVIKVIQRARRKHALTSREIGIVLQLCERLPPQRLQEMSLIHAREPAIDVARGAGQVEGHGYGSRSDHAAINGLAVFTEPLEQHVSAKGDTNEQKWRNEVDCQQPPGDSVDVAGVPGMIESGAAIRFATATTKQQQVSCPPTPNGFKKQPARVMRTCGSLEAVQDDQARPPWWGIETNEIDEVSIVGLPTFDTRFERWGTSEEATPNGSGVWAGKPPRGRIGARYH